ncbi:MAG: hypothetical protein M3Q16_12370 [Pseudomonadota bacterium]|nr:hypothetical protein [Pseudomonadota bacterium]
MRIRITGEKSVIDDLSAELARQGAQVEPAEGSIDRTELALGLLEAAAIIAIVVNIATLIKYLIEIARHLKDSEKRRLEVKTAAGTTLIDIDNKSTPENLEKQLSTHAASVASSDAADKKA